MIAAAAPAPVLDVAARTDPGLRRQVNEDALLAADPCFIVADGMGGHEAGDQASRAAVAAFAEVFTAPGAADLGRIETAIDAARRAVRAIAAGTERGAGCTLTGVIRVVHEGEPYWYVLNVGDSRVYLFRGTRLIQLTHDHSLHSELLAEGSSEAANAPRNVITRALGSEDDRHDAWLLPIESGTRVLVCSDGLTTELDDDQIRAALTVGGRAASVAEDLVARACAAGGSDNISVVVVDVMAGGIDMPQADPDEGDTTLERTRPNRIVR